MRLPFEFMKTMFVNGVGLAVWISLLLTVNMLIPLVVITTVEGQLVLAAMMLGAMTQMAIFASKGFVRLLGVGHVFWVPLLAWLWTRNNGLALDGPFRFWISSIIVLNGASLVIDARDVWRYLAGERTPHLTAG